MPYVIDPLVFSKTALRRDCPDLKDVREKGFGLGALCFSVGAMIVVVLLLLHARGKL
jgi:hypothetical protein